MPKRTNSGLVAPLRGVCVLRTSCNSPVARPLPDHAILGAIPRDRPLRTSYPPIAHAYTRLHSLQTGRIMTCGADQSMTLFLTWCKPWAPQIAFQPTTLGMRRPVTCRTSTLRRRKTMTICVPQSASRGRILAQLRLYPSDRVDLLRCTSGCRPRRVRQTGERHGHLSQHPSTILFLQALHPSRTWYALKTCSVNRRMSAARGRGGNVDFVPLLRGC